MEEAGIRQIKRSISIDIKSVRFLDNELEDRLIKVEGLKEVFESAGRRTLLSGKDSKTNDTPFFNYSRITNLGIFRFYAEAFLKQHPYTDKSQTVILKHEPYTGNGLQLQINMFTKETQFVHYENLQSEIIEHLLAIMHEFGLKIFQQPSEEDLHILSKNEIN
jgi:miniconductance mechanosensitive channel